MRRNLNVIGLLVLTLIAGLAFGTIIKETKQGQSIEFYTNESGTVAKSAELTPSGTLKVNEVTDLAGTGTPPGMIPIGGMVAVMPGVTGAWQPPATTVVKDGFMRADGATVADAASPMNGQVLPNMVNSFARGATTSSITPVGGSDSSTPTGTNTGSAFAGDAEVRTNWFKSQGISASADSHSHSMAHAHATMKVGWNAGYTWGMSSTLSTTSTTTADQGILRAVVWDTSYTGGSYDTITGTKWSKPQISANVNGTQYYSSGAISGTATSMTATGTAAPAVTFNANNNNMEQWAATTASGKTDNYTPTGTMTQPTFTGDSQTNMPVYNNVVWVIRVK